MALSLDHFPKSFLWGVATSAYQIEGAWNEAGRGPCIWDTFTHSRGHIRNEQTADVACDHFHRWPEDFKLLHDLGVNAYRFSLSWSRVLPEGRGPVNAAGLDFYDRLVDALLAAGIQPLPTLYHWDLPQALQDQGGWPLRQTALCFGDYAQLVGQRLGDRVTHWITQNEPMVTALFGHLTGEHAPGIRDARAALQAAHHLLLSHAEGMRALRAAVHGPVKVGIALNLQPVDPASSSTEDQQAAQRFDGMVNRWFLDPLFRASYPQDLLDHFGSMAPVPEPNDLQRIADGLDFLGVNYYTRVVVRHDPEEPVLQARQVDLPNVERSLMWEVYPDGMQRLLERLAQEYHPPAVMITENGIPLADAPDSAGKVNDPARIAFLERHLEVVQAALLQKIPVQGYFAWSFLDNFEWALGYEMRFGLVYVDFTTQKRIPKASADWYRQFISPSRK